MGLVPKSGCAVARSLSRQAGTALCYYAVVMIPALERIGPLAIIENPRVKNDCAL